MQDSWKLSRRSFLKWTGAVASVAAAGGSMLKPTDVTAEPEVTVVQTSCNTNCGGRCVINASTKDGTIVPLETDPDPESPESYQLRACLRGRSARQIARAVR